MGRLRHARYVQHQTEHGIAYGTRVLGRRSLHSSPRRGKPATWRRETGGLTTQTSRYARCETPKRSWELSANVADEGCRWRTSIANCSTATCFCVPTGESTATTVR